MKNIVITGGSGGIGKELALLLSEAHRVLVLSRNQEKLEQLHQMGEDSLDVAVVDLTDENLIDRLRDVLKRNKFDKVDILISNAGSLVNKPFREFNKQEIEQMFAVNVTGLMQCCQAIIPLMNKGSHIVNIGSMGGFQGSAKFPGLSVYSSTKSAVAGFSEALAEELKDDGISVNCLALGAAQTEMLEKAFPGYKAPVSAAEMAEFIAEFALTGNKWINGKVIPVSLSTP